MRVKFQLPPKPGYDYPTVIVWEGDCIEDYAAFLLLHHGDMRESMQAAVECITSSALAEIGCEGTD